MPSCYLIGEDSLVIQCAEILHTYGFFIRGLICPLAEASQWVAHKQQIAHFDSLLSAEQALQRTPFDYLFSIVNRRIISKHLLSRARQFSINYHDGPLPCYAGVNATSWSILNHEKKHGVTWHIINEMIDGGDILKQVQFPIARNETALSLNMKCYQHAQALFIELLTELLCGTYQRVSQNFIHRTYYGLNDKPKGNAWVVWEQPAEIIERMYRACDLGHYINRFCVLKFSLGHDAYVIDQLQMLRETSHSLSGTLVRIDVNQWQIATQTYDMVVTSIRTLEGQYCTLATLAKRYQLQKGICLSSPSVKLQEKFKHLSAEYAKHEVFWIAQHETFKAASFPFLPTDLTEGSSLTCLDTWIIPDQIFDAFIERYPEFECIDVLLTVWLIYLYRLGNTDNLGIAFNERGQASLTNDVQCFFSQLNPLSVSFDAEMDLKTAIHTVSSQRALLNQHKGYLRDLLCRYPNLLKINTVIPIAVVISNESEADDWMNPYLNTALVFRFAKNGRKLSWWMNATCIHSSYFTVAVRAISGHFQSLLSSMITGMPQKIKALTVLTEKEKHKIVFKWNQTKKIYPTDETIIQCFEKQVAKTPKQIAVCDEEASLNYALLNQKAQQLADYLLANGLEAQQCVAVYMDRNITTIIAILGLFKAAAIYIPISTAVPLKQIQFILKDSKPRFLLVQHTIDRKRHLFLVKNYPKIKIIFLDSCLSILSQVTTCQPMKRAMPDDIAYIIYTSGTTGTPKGVMIKHRGLVNLIIDTIARLKLNSKNRVLQFASIGFDASIWELFITLISGATLYIPSTTELLIGTKLSGVINRYQINTIVLPPSLLQTIHPDSVPSLSCIVVGGESCSQIIATVWAKRVFLFNAYGPTEATICSAMGRIIEATDRAPAIGKPVANTTAYVLDPFLSPVPIGVIGELYIGGVGLAAGYLNQPSLTDQMFLYHSFSTSQKIYKTGDRVRWLPEGQLDYIGRKDHQVKIRGLRIELEAIEAAILSDPNVCQCIVSVREDQKHQKHLVAYLVTADQPLDSTKLRKFLATKLSSYMIPSFFIQLDAFSLTANGKLNRKALPMVELTKKQFDTKYDAPKTEIEKKIAQCWQDLFSLQEIGLNDSFFDLGGNSISLTGLILTIEKHFNTILPLSDFLKTPTIACLAKLIVARDAKNIRKQSKFIKYTVQASHLDLKINCRMLNPLKEVMTGILLTGATGFLGVHILRDLHCATSANLYCLIQAEDDTEAFNRMESTLLRYQFDDLIGSKRIIPLSGNLAKKNLGLSQQLFFELSNDVSSIIHNGAWVNHIYDYEQLKAANVNSTLELLRLATTHQLKKIHFVSTLTAVIDSSHASIDETFATSKTRPLFENGYLQTKWVSERLLTQAHERGIPVCVYRPTWIGGESKTGWCNPDKNHFLHLLKACIQSGYAPDFDIAFNLLPVNFISDVIVKLSLGYSNHHVFNLSHPYSMTWKQLIDWVNDYGYSMKRVSYATWKKKCFANFDASHALYPFAALYISNQGTDWLSIQSKVPVIQIKQTQFSLVQMQINYPPITRALIYTYLDYLSKVDFLSY